MIRAILLDCGGVLVKPATGDWLLSPGFEAILGEDFARARLDAFRSARRAFLPLLPDTQVVGTDGEEYDLFIPYFRAVFAAMGFPLTDEALHAFARLQVYTDARYILFGDVLPMLGRWKDSYRLGILSDAPPSTRRIMDRFGVTERLHAATYSCEIGRLKPDPAIYRLALEKLGMRPEEAVFVDDLGKNLEGAERLGIRGIQMRRPMPEAFPVAERWDGPIAEDLEGVAAWIDAQNARERGGPA